MEERKYICQSTTFKKGKILTEYVKKCLTCGKEMVRKGKVEAMRKSWNFCSYACRTIYKNKNKVWRESEINKLSQKMKENWKLGKYKNVLSRERIEKCRFNNIGRKSHFWIDGRTSLLRRLRNTNKMAEWRDAIFKRDNWTCVLCKIKNKKGLGKTIKLNADHYPKRFPEMMRENNIWSFEDGIECNVLWDISIGRTLCLDCHKKTPTFGRKANLVARYR